MFDSFRSKLMIESRTWLHRSLKKVHYLIYAVTTVTSCSNICILSSARICCHPRRGPKRCNMRCITSPSMSGVGVFGPFGKKPLPIVA